MVMKKIAIIFICFFFSHMGRSEEIITSAVHVDSYQHWTRKGALRLADIHHDLSGGVSDTKLYSETTSAAVLHKTDNETLYFIFPTETELQKNLEDLKFKYTYLESDKDTRCFNSLSNQDGYVTTINEDCILHPFIFEGKTRQGKPFKVEILFWNRDGYIFQEESPEGSSTYPVLNMDPYNIVTPNNPLRIKLFPKPTAMMEPNNFSLGLVYDNNTGELVMTKEATESILLSKRSVLETFIAVYYMAGESYRSGAFTLNVFLLGKCEVKNPPDLSSKFPQLIEGDIVVLYCATNERYRNYRYGGYLPYNEITKRSHIKADGSFHFTDAPIGCGCNVKALFLDGRGDIDLPSEYICPEEKKHIYNRGDGHYVVHEHNGDNDTLRFGKGITKDDLFSAYGDNGSLIIGLKEDGKASLDNHDIITIMEHREGNGYIENILFDNGTALDALGIMSILGTEDSDRVDGTLWTGADTFNWGGRGGSYCS
jgi:hypothetical protein